jgi:hypothetical protein
MRNLVLGFVALVLVAAIFVNRQIQSEEGVEPVLVARQLIPPGTSGNLVQSQKMVALTTLPRREVEDGAISDPLDLRSRVAAMHIPWPPAHRRELHRAPSRGAFPTSLTHAPDDPKEGTCDT